jgi:ribosomal-protein-alanine N-acetyltransferase
MPNSIGRTHKVDPRIRRLELRDVDAVLSIQSACREIAQWTNQDYVCIASGQDAARNAGPDASSIGLVAERAPDVMGFLMARQIAGDLEILNLAVHPGIRREGVGTALLLEAVNWANSFDAENAFLEVRESNLPALRFYELHNFRVTGRRRGYYASPPEDALLLTAPVCRSSTPSSL